MGFNDPRTYTIVARYLEHGEPGTRRWRVEETEIYVSYEEAGRQASQVAKSLDAEYGDDHFWTVDLKGKNGSYFQLFHGRLS